MQPSDHPYFKDFSEILLTDEQIKKRCLELSSEISKDYASSKKTLVMICVLRGASYFFADLTRNIIGDVHLDFIVVSSYGSGTQSTGSVKILKDIEENIEGKDVILVEDVIDTGLTLRNLVQLLNQRKPNSIKIASLLDKVDAHKTPVDAKYVGFPIPNKFVVGYGLDYDQKYRNLPFVAVLSPSVYAKPK